MHSAERVIPRIVGEALFFVGGTFFGALLAFLFWFHWRLVGLLVVSGGSAIVLMRLGYAMRHGRPAQSTSMLTIHKALSDVLAPGSLRMSRSARLGPLFGLGLTVYLLVVGEYGDGRPFTW